MRSAEERVMEYVVNPKQAKMYGKNGQLVPLHIVIVAINEARRECIDECAEAAKLAFIYLEYNEERRDYDYETVVDKQSILKLKEQII